MPLFLEPWPIRDDVRHFYRRGREPISFQKEISIFIEHLGTLLSTQTVQNRWRISSSEMKNSNDARFNPIGRNAEERRVCCERVCVH